MNILRSVVSRGRKGLKQEKVNRSFAYLDMVYITSKVIAMSTPAAGIHKLYRNDELDVFKYLTTQLKDNWILLNLCAEETVYHLELFKPNVINYGFQDHNPPPLLFLWDIVMNMDALFQTQPLLTLVVHCKAGKGRTGTVICSYLVAFGGLTAKQSLELYTEKRMVRGHGLTISSQIRYVYYIEILKQFPNYLKAVEFNTGTIFFKSFKCLNIKKNSSLILSLHAFSKGRNINPVALWKSSDISSHNVSIKEGKRIWEIQCNLETSEKDLLLRVERKGQFYFPSSVQCWFHTHFQPMLVEYTNGINFQQGINSFLQGQQSISFSWSEMDNSRRSDPFFEQLTIVYENVF